MEGIGLLRDIQPNELELMLSWRNYPSVRNNMYTRHEIGLEEHLTWWDSILTSNNQMYFMYEYDEAPLGIVAFTDIDYVNKNSFWAFYASPDAPRGTGSKMEFLALDYVFDEIKLHKFNAEVLAYNSRVLKLHEKFGFRTEGVLLQEKLINGEFIDVHRMSIFSKEWKSNREKVKSKLMIFSQK